jgi:hypothetical protein
LREELLACAGFAFDGGQLQTRRGDFCLKNETAQSRADANELGRIFSGCRGRAKGVRRCLREVEHKSRKRSLGRIIGAAGGDLNGDG